MTAPPPKFEPCESCSGGWLTDASGAAYRCVCWRAYVNKWIDQLNEKDGK